MGTIKRGYVDTSIGQLHYREAGSGPAVLFVHQAGRTGATYHRVTELMAPHHRVIAIDLPGFGGSDPLPMPCTVTDLVDTVIEALDGLGIDDVRLSGHHTGAVIVGEIAASHPERVAAFAPSGYPFYQSAKERYQVPKEDQVPTPIFQIGGHSVPIAPALHADGSHLLRVFQRAVAMLWYSKVALGETDRSIMLPFENLSPEDLAFINDFVVENLIAVNSGAGTLAAVRGYNSSERLPLITAPTLFVQSTGLVEAMFCQRGEALQELVPGSRVATIENGDIHVSVTRPEELSAILIDFFREVDGSS